MTRKFPIFWMLLIPIIVFSVVLAVNLEKPPNTDNLRLRTVMVFVLSFLLTCTLIFLLSKAFGKLNLTAGIFNFFIGDEGSYSLSRLQAILWAVVIITYQLGVLLALIFNHRIKDPLHYYQPSFSESAIWLLGLSLTSCIVVKGITIDRIVKHPYLRYRNDKPSWKDVLTSENGLDFSKCHMLIWTIIALFIFSTKCYYFFGQILSETPDNINRLFSNYYEEYSGNTVHPTDGLPYIPYLPWTFVVLMGLSQGTYIGKKLVPSFKAEEATNETVLGNENDIAKLDLEIASQREILANLTPITETGIARKQAGLIVIQELLRQRLKIQINNNSLMQQKRNQ